MSNETGIHKIVIPIFDRAVYFVDDWDKYSQFMETVGVDVSDDEQTLGITRAFQHQPSMETVFLVGCFDESPNTLIHETGHLVFLLLDLLGLPNPTNDDNELFCYLLGYVYNEFLMVAAKPPKD